MPCYLYASPSFQFQIRWTGLPTKLESTIDAGRINHVDQTRIVAALTFSTLVITALILFVPADQVLIQTEVILAIAAMFAVTLDGPKMTRNRLTSPYKRESNQSQHPHHRSPPYSPARSQSVSALHPELRPRMPLARLFRVEAKDGDRAGCRPWLITFLLANLNLVCRWPRRNFLVAAAGT